MIVFVWFCMKFIWPPILNAIEERQQQIEEGLAAADKGQESLAKAAAEADEIVAKPASRQPAFSTRRMLVRTRLLLMASPMASKSVIVSYALRKRRSSRKLIVHAKSFVARCRPSLSRAPRKFCSAKSTARRTRTFWASWLRSCKTSWLTTTQ